MYVLDCFYYTWLWNIWNTVMCFLNLTGYNKLILNSFYRGGNSRNRGSATYTISPNEAEPAPPVSPNRGTPSSVR